MQFATNWILDDSVRFHNRQWLNKTFGKLLSECKILLRLQNHATTDVLVRTHIDRLYFFFFHYSIELIQARTQTFEKGGRGVRRGEGVANLRAFTKGDANLPETSENSDFEAKIRGVNSVSGEKLHDFKIICPARGAFASPPPPARHALRKGLL